MDAETVSAETINGVLGVATVVCVSLAALLAVVSFRMAAFGRSSPVWRGKAEDLDRRLARMDSLFRAYPGLALVWDASARGARARNPVAKIRNDKTADRPRTFGSPAALASLRRFAADPRSSDVASEVLKGLDAFELVGAAPEAKLSDLIGELRLSGKAFSVSLLLPSGGALDATGRVAGAQAVVWLDDPALRGDADEADAIRRLDQNRSTALRDPLAFIDMLDRAVFPAWRTDADGRIRWANPAYVKSVGAQGLGEVLATQMQLDADMPAQAAKAASTGERQVDVRPVVVRGQRRSLRISVYPVSGGLAGVAVDATEAEQLRTALLGHIRAHDETLNALREAVVIFGPDRKMRFHNRAFSELFGLDESWYAGTPTHGEWLDRIRETRNLPEQADYSGFRRAELALYTDWPDEMPDEMWMLPDGRTLRVVRQRDPEGGLLLLFSDITTQMTLQSQLGTLINVQKATLDKLSEGIGVWGTDGRLRLFNRAFARMWNLPEARLSENPRFAELTSELMLLHPDRTYWEGLIARVTDPDPDVRRMVEGNFTRADKTFFTWFSRPLPDGATLVAFEDRTQAMEAETALRQQAEMLEEANRIKSDFVGHISYQLRTPLTTISGFAELLQTEVKGELNDEQSGSVFAIQSAARELTKTIDDILDIAAIEADVLKLDLGEVDVYELLDNTLDYVATRAERTQIHTRLSCSRDIGAIRADGSRLRQVVYNLLLNALRYTKPGGHIEVGAERMAEGVRLWVRDDGEGISPDVQPQIFDSFQSSRGGGAGLGLALVKKFVKRHGGWVELDSEPGRGTHVNCYLPDDAGPDSVRDANEPTDDRTNVLADSELALVDFESVDFEGARLDDEPLDNRLLNETLSGTAFRGGGAALGG